MPRSSTSSIFARVVLAPALALLAGQAFAYSALYAFGDSLTDTGNVAAATGGLQPVAPYYNGRFSNGPVWIDTLAANLGLSIDPSVSGGTNYAFGAAVTGPTLTSVTPTLKKQANLYLTASGGVADPDALYVVWGGGDDARAGGNPASSMTNAVANVQGIITTLAGKGARNFLVANLPDLGRTPEAIAGGPVLQAQQTLLATSFNAGLGSSLPGLATGLAVNITELDVYSLLNQLIANPAAYGFTNTTDACYSGELGVGGPGAVCVSPDQYVFWDAIHPTAAAHTLIGNYATAVLVPVPTALALFASALAGLSLGRRRRTS